LKKEPPSDSSPDFYVITFQFPCKPVLQAFPHSLDFRFIFIFLSFPVCLASLPPLSFFFVLGIFSDKTRAEKIPSNPQSPGISA